MLQGLTRLPVTGRAGQPLELHILPPPNAKGNSRTESVRSDGLSARPRTGPLALGVIDGAVGMGARDERVVGRLPWAWATSKTQTVRELVTSSWRRRGHQAAHAQMASAFPSGLWMQVSDRGGQRSQSGSTGGSRRALRSESRLWNRVSQTWPPLFGLGLGGYAIALSGWYKSTCGDGGNRTRRRALS